MSDFRRALIEEIPRLRRFARGLTGNASDADDLVQSTLTRALEKSDLWRAGTNLRAWLFTIMHNLFISDRRRLKRSVTWQDEVLPGQMVGATTDDQESRLRLHDVERALQSLSYEHRAVVLMVALEGMSYEEIARVHDVPVGTVRSRLSRARAELRRNLDEDEDAVRIGLAGKVSSA